MVNCRTLFIENTPPELMEKLWDDGWVPLDKWNIEYLAAMRKYAKQQCKPITVFYEGIYWFTYSEEYEE